MLNATQPSAKSSASASSSNNNGIINLNMGTKSEQDKSWNFVQDGINNNDYATTNKSSSNAVNNSASGNQTTPVSSASAKSNVSSNSVSAKPSFNSAYKSYMASMSGIDSEVASANDVNVDSNNNKNQKKKALLKGTNNSKTFNYAGMTIKYNPANQSAEVISGTLPNVQYYGPRHYASGFMSGFKGLNHGHAFDDRFLYNTKTITFDSDVSTDNLTNMENMFGLSGTNQHIISIDISRLNLSHVINMQDIFRGDSSLQSVKLPDNLNSVTNMQSMFAGDPSLHSVKLPDNLNSVTNMQSMFAGDFSLQSVKLPKINTKNINYAGLFSLNNKLTSITIQSPKTIFDNRNLFTFTNPRTHKTFGTIPKMYKEIGTSDSNGKPYTLSIPNDFSQGNVGTFTTNRNPEPATYNGMTYKYDKNTNTIEFTGGTFENSRASYISDLKAWSNAGLANAPSDIKNANNITFDSDVDTSHLTNMSGEFLFDTNLRTIDLSHLKNLDKVTNIEGIFGGGLQSITLPADFGKNATNTKNAFNVNSWYRIDSQQGNGKYETSDYDISNKDCSLNQTKPIQAGKYVSTTNFNTTFHFINILNGQQVSSNISQTDSGPLSNSTVPSNFIPSNSYVVDKNGKRISPNLTYYPAKTIYTYYVSPNGQGIDNGWIYKYYSSENKIEFTGDKSSVINTTKPITSLPEKNVKTIVFDKSVPVQLNNWNKKDQSDDFTTPLNNNQQNIQGTLEATPNPKVNNTDNVVFEYQDGQYSDGTTKYHVAGEPLQYYGMDGSNETLKSTDIPTGYHLVNGESNRFKIGVYTNNPVKDEYNTHIFLVQSNNNKHIPAIPNTVNVKGTVTLQFSDADNVVRTITLPYLAQDTNDSYVYPLQEVNNNGEFNTPNDFLGKYIQNFDTNNYTYEGNGNDKTIGRIQPSKVQTDFNHGSTNLITNNVTLKYKATNNHFINHMSDNIEYITSDGHTMGQQIVQGSDGKSFDLTNNLNVPNGYHLVNPNNNLTYDGRTHNIQITGNIIPQPNTPAQNLKPSDTKPSSDNMNTSTKNEEITVNANEYNKLSDISNQDNPNKTIPTNIDLAGHHIGDTITINPSEYTPAGYKATKSDEPVTVTIVPEPNNNYGLKANNSNFANNVMPYNFVYDAGNQATNPTTVQYVNQDTHKVITSKVHNVPSGTQIEVSSDVPEGYTLSNPNQPTVVASDKPSNPSVQVIGNQADTLNGTNKGMVDLHVVEKNSEGKSINSYNVQVNEGSARVGSDFTINPQTDKDSNGNPLQPKGFTKDPSVQQIKGTITPNGAITNSGTDTLIYDATNNPVQVHFNDIDNHNSNFTPITVNGDPDSKITNANLPVGYHLPSDANYSFNSQGQLMNNGQPVPSDTVAIKGDVVQGKANIVLQYNIMSPSDKNVVKTITNTADDAQVILNGEIGGSEKINPWKYWKTNFTLPKDLASQSDTIHFTPNDVNAKNEDGQQFNPTLIYTSSARLAGDVAVQYVDVDNNNAVIPISGKNVQQNWSDVGNFNGLVGQQVELGQTGANKDVEINNDNGVHYVLNVPDGYHLEHNANPITLQAGQIKLDKNGNWIVPKAIRKFGMTRLMLGSMFHRPIGLMLTVGLSNPMEHKSNSASTTTNSASASSSNTSTSSASDSSSMIPAIAPSSTSSSASTSTASSLVSSLEGNTYITNDTTTTTTNNYNYSNSSNSMATNSDTVKANASSNTNDNSARTASDNADKSGMIDINNRPNKTIDTTTNNNHKVSNLSNRLPMKNHYYVYSPKNIILYGKHGAIKISRRKGFTGKIMKVTKFHGKKAFVIRWHHKNFIVNAKHTRNAYIQPKEYNHYAHGIIKHATIKLRKNAIIYKSIHFNKHNAKRTVKSGNEFTVIGIKSFGEKGYERTRFILSNGLIITANKNYVKFI